MNLYKCNICDKVVARDSNKQWMLSYCDEKKTTSRLIRIELNDKLVSKLCKKLLPNKFDLSTFKEKELLLLKSAFEQGATVMMNYVKIDKK